MYNSLYFKDQTSLSKTKAKLLEQEHLEKLQTDVESIVTMLSLPTSEKKYITRDERNFISKVLIEMEQKIKNLFKEIRQKDQKIYELTEYIKKLEAKSKTGYDSEQEKELKGPEINVEPENLVSVPVPVQRTQTKKTNLAEILRKRKKSKHREPYCEKSSVKYCDSDDSKTYGPKTIEKQLETPVIKSFEELNI
jgi:hypothetical protein